MGPSRIRGVVGAVLTSVFIVGACTSGATPAPTAAPATAAATAAASSAAPASQAAKKLKIGVTFPILDQFLQTVADGMKAKATELGNVELNIVAAQEKTDVQLGQVENFISQKVDAIIVIPVDTDAAGPMTAKATGGEDPARLRQPSPVRPADEGRARTSAPTRSTRARWRWSSWRSSPTARATSSS